MKPTLYILITMCDQLNKIRAELQRLADENPNFLNAVSVPPVEKCHHFSVPPGERCTICGCDIHRDSMGKEIRKEAVVGDAYREPFTMAEWGEARRKAVASGNPLVGGDLYAKVAEPTTGRNNPGGGGSSAGVTPRLQNPESLVKPTHANPPKAVMVDIDGTVALKCNRSPYDESKVSQDTSNEAVVELVKTLKSSGYQIVYVSGRTDSCWLATQVWLEKRDIWDGKLFMRRTGDSRKDSIVKEELYRDFVEGRFNVAFVIDDRKQVVDMWRSLGLTCLQCAEGNF